MPYSRPVRPHKTHRSYGCHLLDHLAAHRTGLAAGQVAVVAHVKAGQHSRGHRAGIAVMPEDAGGSQHGIGDGQMPAKLGLSVICRMYIVYHRIKAAARLP